MKSIGFGVWQGNKILNNRTHKGVVNDDKAACGSGYFAKEGCHGVAELGGGFT